MILLSSARENLAIDRKNIAFARLSGAAVSPSAPAPAR